MIGRTKANCRISNISISENTATITLLVFAIESTEETVSFQIYCNEFKTDGSSSKSLVSPKSFWVDSRNYNNDEQLRSTNVDTNKYKEIIINVDITNSNQSSIQYNRWVRDCYITFVNNADGKTIWSSEVLNLVSDEFEIPTINNINFKSILDSSSDVNTDPRYFINANFSLSYTSEKDFNYNNKNFSIYMRIINVATKKIIEESNPLVGTELYHDIRTSNSYPQGTPVIVEIIITNKNGEIYQTVSKTYRPTYKHTSCYIKTTDGVKKVIGVYTLVED